LRRYIECALRIKFRLLLAAVLVFGSAFAFLYLSKQGYTSTATVWVDRPIYFNTPNDWNQYRTPADNQANILSELIRTRQFSLTVAQRAQVSMHTTAEEGVAIDDIQRNLKVDTFGDHLVRITYTNKQPTYGTAIISQTIGLFVEQLSVRQASEAQSAVQLYQDQLTTAQKDMDQARQQLTDYIQKNPESVAIGAGANPVLTDFQQQYDSARSRYDDLVSKINGIKTDSGAANLVSSDFFRLVDPPLDPEPTPLVSKANLVNAGMAGGLALLLALAFTLISTWTDPLLYTLHDISRVVAVEDDSSAPDVLVGAVPYLKGIAGIRQAKGARPDRRQPNTIRGREPATSNADGGVALAASASRSSSEG
jgi:uncharacterized protein involved in exopolysaccharide biosynthesis